VIFGASGHGKVVADTAMAAGITVLAFTDDDAGKQGTDHYGFRIIPASVERLRDFCVAQDARVVIAIGDNKSRRETFDRLKEAGIELGTVLDPSAVVSPTARIGRGTVVFGGAVINADTSIGENVIVNTGATVDHDCQVDAHVHISPGAHLGGNVTVGEGTTVGLGAHVRNNIRIGSWSFVGMGSVVVRDIPDGVTAYGVPAVPKGKARVPADLVGNRATPARAPGVEAFVASPEDKVWTDVMAASLHDFYHLPSFVALEAKRTKGTAAGFVVHEKDSAVLVPLVVRQMPAELGKEFEETFDAVSPYGYPGILLYGPLSQNMEWMRAAIVAMIELLAQRRICSVFVRLRSMRPQPIDPLREAGTVVRNGEVVWLDLKASKEQYGRELRENHRRSIARMKKMSASVRIDAGWSRVKDFVRIYYETMTSVGADPMYFFTEEYFRGLREVLGGRGFLCVVELGDELVCGGIFTEFNGLVQYHLGATADKFRRLSPSPIMFDFMRNWGHERGAEKMNLGGGVGGTADSLLHFKAGFSPNRAPFNTWRLVSMPSVYERAVARWSDIKKAPAEPATAYFPAYRKGMGEG